jgi:hypothetical protein
MATRAELLFEKLQTKEAIEALIGEAEDADFDCKECRGTAENMRVSIAKAACGFCNATGGVIVIGLRADGRGGEPDVVRELKPVDDMGAVKSAALDIILKFVKPGIEGVQVEMVPDSPGGTSGYVLLFIPEGEGSPQRTDVAPKNFYVRVASGTIPMEYFQVEDRFGRRPRPRLIVTASSGEVKAQPMGSYAERVVRISVINDGRGVARFPALRVSAGFGFNPETSPFDNNAPVWGLLNNNEGWYSYRGGSNDVIYPGETLAIATLTQLGTRTNQPAAGAFEPYSHMPLMLDWNFPETKIIAIAVCEGAPLVRRTFDFNSYVHLARKG